ncbi:alpha/beta hydrolase [Rubellimicrobium sp. CFH 75288]|uniref:alpha/beta hydrolase n=1 Tax=Rubellimicrobium sp. CFH 75288 TaxID=2697034 RepID=UPI0014127953|nr:alpha/beta hydrolase [Rubellimicrobium sp. CFH 75288]NAZ37566.1 alpha/beta hydrolase fold domain-containing protein [Rubellimicrobium sp. CFH 75288]
MTVPRREPGSDAVPTAAPSALPDLSDAYANAVHIPGGEDYPARWAAAAAAFRAAHPPRTLAHGPGPRDRLDLFRPDGTPQGLLVFFHGGYWMAFGREDFSHLAAGALGRGWAVAIPSLPLAPGARIGAIVRAAARAAEAAAAQMPDAPLALAGHSAGGHLAARLACPDVPLACRSRLACVLAISPLANLAPLMRTAMNATLRLDPAECAAESPLLRPRPPVRVTVWVGEGERPAFRDQALWLSRAWDAPLVVEPGRHHFDVIAGLETPAHALARTATGEAP